MDARISKGLVGYVQVPTACRSKSDFFHVRTAIVLKPDKRRSSLEPKLPSNTTPIDLADTPPFRLGIVVVEPAGLRLKGPAGAQVHLQPRAMQVLVALQRGSGDTLSREELNRRCWNGRVVGADAIDRTIAHLRRAGTELGSSFRIETIPRVGFRLSCADTQPDACDQPEISASGAPPDLSEPAASVRSKPNLLSRRAAIAAAGVLGVAVIAATSRFWTIRTLPPSNNTEARSLIALGSEALRQGLPEQARQAVSYFERATELQPSSADAWGGLALAHLQLIDDSREEIEAARVRSASARALAIDPGNASAAAALILSPPMFRNWAPVERATRRGLELHPASPALLTGLGCLNIAVGRWRDGVAVFRRSLAVEPLQPRDRIHLAIALWGAGDLAGADAVFLDAARLWPGHRYLWLWRLHFLALTERAREAKAVALNEETRPPQGPGEIPLPYDAYVSCAQALFPDGISARENAIASLMAARALGTVGTWETVLYLAAFGRSDAVFAMLDHYYFGGGQTWLHPPEPLTRRDTAFLFLPPIEGLRRSPRFAKLMYRIGLSDYWRQTGTGPDDRAGVALARP